MHESARSEDERDSGHIPDEPGDAGDEPVDLPIPEGPPGLGAGTFQELLRQLGEEAENDEHGRDQLNPHHDIWLNLRAAGQGFAHGQVLKKWAQYRRTGDLDELAGAIVYTVYAMQWALYNRHVTGEDTNEGR